MIKIFKNVFNITLYFIIASLVLSMFICVHEMQDTFEKIHVDLEIQNVISLHSLKPSKSIEKEEEKEIELKIEKNI